MTDYMYVEDIELDAKLAAEAYRLDGDPEKGKKFRAFAASHGLKQPESKLRALYLLLEYNPEYCRVVKERAQQIWQEIGEGT